MIELMLYLVCTLGSCHVAPLMVTPAAVAVASCESGDTVTFGSYSMTAKLRHRRRWGVAIQRCHLRLAQWLRPCRAGHPAKSVRHLRLSLGRRGRLASLGIVKALLDKVVTN